MQPYRVDPGVAAQQRGPAAVGTQQPEEDPDRRGLSRAVRPEESGDLPPGDCQVEAAERVDAAEALRQAADLDGHLGFTHGGLPSWCGEKQVPSRRPCGARCLTPARL